MARDWLQNKQVVIIGGTAGVGLSAAWFHKRCNVHQWHKSGTGVTVSGCRPAAENIDDRGSCGNERAKELFEALTMNMPIVWQCCIKMLGN